MSDTLPPLFDFAPHVGQSEHFLQTIREFAAGRAFRSASVDELVLEDDFYRRPLRPEDFEFLKFAKPVRADNVSRLPSLASQRTLNCLYELTTAVPPPSSDAARNAAFLDFASERNRHYAAQLAPFLEAYAFSYLTPAVSPANKAADLPSRLAQIYTHEVEFLSQLFAGLSAREYLQEGLRFVLIQRWCLAPSLRKVLAETQARGHFVDWPDGTAPQLNGRLLGDEALAQLAVQVGVDRQQHSFWQFYLPTSLSRCNLVYALARRPERAFELYGALFAMEALWLAFETAVARSCPHLTAGRRIESSAPEKLIEQLQRRFASALRFMSRAACARCRCTDWPGTGLRRNARRTCPVGSRRAAEVALGNRPIRGSRAHHQSAHRGGMPGHRS